MIHYKTVTLTFAGGDLLSDIVYETRSRSIVSNVVNVSMTSQFIVTQKMGEGLVLVDPDANLIQS